MYYALATDYDPRYNHLFNEPPTLIDETWRTTAIAVACDAIADQSEELARYKLQRNHAIKTGNLSDIEYWQQAVNDATFWLNERINERHTLSYLSLETIAVEFLGVDPEYIFK